MRNPHNTNQTLHFDPFYKAFPVQVRRRGPLILEYLERLHRVLADALNAHRRLFVVRIDLRYSLSRPLPSDALTNEPIQKFLASLKAKLDYKDLSRRQDTGRVNEHDMRYAWALEVGSQSARPHYHVVLMFNGDAYRSLGDYSNPGAEGLYRRILEAWAGVIGLSVEDAQGLVSVCRGGQWKLDHVDQSAYKDAFFACSYLCKAATKPFGRMVSCFGASRRPPKRRLLA